MGSKGQLPLDFFGVWGFAMVCHRMCSSVLKDSSFWFDTKNLECSNEYTDGVIVCLFFSRKNNSFLSLKLVLSKQCCIMWYFI